jgi:hypothetical protein
MSRDRLVESWICTLGAMGRRGGMVTSWSRFRARIEYLEADAKGSVSVYGFLDQSSRLTLH